VLRKECDMKLRDKERDDVRKELDTTKKQLSKLKAEHEDLKGAIQHTKSGPRFLIAPEKGKMRV